MSRSGVARSCARASTMAGTSRKLTRSGMKGNLVVYSTTRFSTTTISGSRITATATVSFTLPQVVAVAQQCRRGVERARATGVKPGKCFAVIMIGRLDDYLREVAHDSEAGLSETDIRQAGLAVTKRAYRLYQERGYEAVLLVAALRGDYHLTELAGADLVMSIAPAYQHVFVSQDFAREERIEKEIPRDVLDRLRRLPEFVRAYEPDGMAPQEFIACGVTQRTLSQFIEAGWRLLESFQ